MIRVEITGKAGHGTVAIDGVEIKGVKGIDVMMRAGQEMPLVRVELAPTELVMDLEAEAKLIEIIGRAAIERRQATICTRCGHDKAKGFCPMTPPGSGCPEDLT